MSAATILPHQLAASILFAYALLALCFSVRRPPQSVKPLTHLDVDLEYCTVEELEYMQATLLTSGRGMSLTPAEINRFWELCIELDSRRFN